MKSSTGTACVKPAWDRCPGTSPASPGAILRQLPVAADSMDDDESDTEAGSSTDGGELEPADATDAECRWRSSVWCSAMDNRSMHWPRTIRSALQLILAGQDKLADGEYYWANDVSTVPAFRPRTPTRHRRSGTRATRCGGLYLIGTDPAESPWSWPR